MKLNELKTLEESLTPELDEEGYFIYEDDVRAWLAGCNVMSGDFTYDKRDRTVNFTQVKTGLTLTYPWHWKRFTELPIRVEDFWGTLSINMKELTTLRGLPETTTGTLVVKECHNITSFDSYPKHIGGALSLPTNIQSLEGIAGHIESIGIATSRPVQLVFPMHNVMKGGLGLLNIKSLNGIGDTHGMNFANLPTYKPWEIIAKHLKGNKDIFDCQQELIEAGYEEYAEL